MDLLRITTLLAIFLLPFGNVFRFQIIPGVNVLALDVVMFYILFLVVLRYYKNFTHYIFRKNFPFQLFIVTSVVGLVISVFSFLHFSEFLISLLYLLRLIAYISFWPAIVLVNGKDNKYLYSLLSSGILFSLLGIIQYVLLPNLILIEFLGWDRHYFRVTSTFFDPNFAGIIILLTIILLIGALLLTEAKRKKMLLLFLPLCLIAFFLTYSRGSYLAAIASIPFLFVLLRKWKLIFTFLAVMGIGILLIPKNLRSEGVDLFRTASIIGRLESFGVGIVIFLKNPIFGVGYNALRYAQNYYGFLTDAYWKVTNAGAGVSNSYIFLLSTSGVVGFTLFFLTFWSIAKHIAHLSIKKDVLAATTASSIIAVLVHSLTENSLFYPFVLMWISGLLGIFASQKKIIPGSTKQ